MAFGAEIARLFVRIGADISELKSGLRDAGHAVDNAVSGFDKVGSKFSSAGRALTVGLTAPIVAIGGLALKASIDFESAFAGVRKTVDGTEDDFARLRKGILDMSKEMPSSAKDIARVAEAAGQLGVKRDDILAFTQTMIKVGTATNLAAEDAAVGFARLANIMQLPITEVDKLADVLVDLGNKGASTESQIMDMALRIAGAGNLIGLSATSVLGFANALASLGIEAEMGGSAISRVMLMAADAVHQFVAGASPEQMQAITDAQRGIRDATEGVASAQQGAVSAAQNLADAHKTLAAAQRDQVQASLDARRETLSVAEAQQSLTELQAKTGAGALELQSAQLSLAEAQGRVAEAGKRGGLALQQAQLGVAQAMQRVNEVMARAPRAALEMQNAELRLAEAKNRVGAAAKAQAEKIQAANRQIVQSHQGVRTAQISQRRAAEGLTDAHAAMRQAVGASSLQLRGFAQVAGMTAQEFASLFKTDPEAAMVAFVKGLQRVKEEGGNVNQVLRDLGMDDIRVRDTLLRMASGHEVVSKSLRDAAQAYLETGAAQQEFDKRVQTTAAQLQIQTNKMMASFIEMGDQLTPVLRDLAAALTPLSKALSGLTQAFAGLPGPLQTAILGFIGFLTVIGPVRGGLGFFMSGLKAIGGAGLILMKLHKAFMIARLGLLAFMGPLAPFILVAAALALAAYLIYKHWDKIGPLLAKTATFIKNTVTGALTKVLDFVKDKWPEIATLIALPFAPLVALATDAFGVRSALVKAFDRVFDLLPRKAKNALDKVKDEIASVGKAVKGGFQIEGLDVSTDAGKIGQAAGRAAGGDQSFLKRMAFEAGEAAAKVNRSLGSIFDFVERLWPGLGDMLAKPFMGLGTLSIGTGMLSGLDGLVAGVKIRLNDLLTYLQTSGAAETIGYLFGTIAFALVSSFRESLEELYGLITQTIPRLQAQGLLLGLTLATAVGKGLLTSAQAILTFFGVTLPALLIQQGPVLAASALQIGMSIAKGIWGGLSTGNEAIRAFFMTILPGLIGAALTLVITKSLSLGASIAKGIWDGIVARWNFIERIPGAIGDALKEGFNAYVDFWAELGKDIVRGIWDGMQSRMPWLAKQLGGFLKGIYRAGQDAVIAKSPSKLFAELGGDIMAGVRVGLDRTYSQSVQPAMSSMAKGLTQAFVNGTDSALQSQGIYRGWQVGTPEANAAARGGPIGPMGGPAVNRPGMQQDVEKWAKTGFPGAEPLASPEAKAFFAKWGQAGMDAFLKRWREVRNLVQIAPNQWAKPGQPATSAAGDLESGARQAGQGVTRFAVAASSAAGATSNAASAMSGAAESVTKAGVVVDTTANALKNLHVGFDFTKPLEPGAGAGQDLGKIKRTPVKGPVGFRVPSLAVGTPRVPEDMLSWLHRGEMVIPRGVADTMRGERGDLQSGGLAMNFNAPFTVVNQERNVDVNKVITEIAYTTQNDLRQRGVRR